MNVRFVKWLAVGCVCAGPMLRADGPALGDPGYRFDTWKVEQGLPQNQVQTILQTRDGYLWIGTRFGLARFDGVRFTTFTLANMPAMVSDNCVALAED